MKKYNFNAGPSILPDVVLEAAAKAIIDFNGTGLSLLSISHRTPEFEAVLAEAQSLFRELLNIPDNYKIYFVGGGASTQFFHIPANFLGKKAGYVNTGVWTKKAIKARTFKYACRFNGCHLWVVLPIGDHNVAGKVFKHIALGFGSRRVAAILVLRIVVRVSV